MAVTIGVPFAVAAAALAKFGGVARRFDIRGVDDGVTLVDDYGHLPSEIAAVLAAARGSGDGWQRVVVAFQPNRFNRMAVMWPDYCDAFVDADLVVLTDIYAAGEDAIEGVSLDTLAARVRGQLDVPVEVVRALADVAPTLARLAQPGDVVITLGAGSIASVPEQLLALLQPHADHQQTTGVQA